MGDSSFILSVVEINLGECVNSIRYWRKSNLSWLWTQNAGALKDRNLYIQVVLVTAVSQGRVRKRSK